MLVPPESLSAVLVMIRSKSVSIRNQVSKKQIVRSFSLVECGYYLLLQQHFCYSLVNSKILKTFSINAHLLFC